GREEGHGASRGRTIGGLDPRRAVRALVVLSNLHHRSPWSCSLLPYPRQVLPMAGRSNEGRGREGGAAGLPSAPCLRPKERTPGRPASSAWWAAERWARASPKPQPGPGTG